MPRSYRRARKLYINERGVPLASRVLEKILSGARRVSAPCSDEFWRFLQAALRWKDNIWWRHCRDFFAQVDPNARKETWKHPHQGRPRVHWEDMLEVVTDSDDWRAVIYNHRDLNNRQLMRTFEAKAYEHIKTASPVPTKKEGPTPKDVQPALRLFAAGAMLDNAPRKRVRFSLDSDWNYPPHGCKAIEIIGDSLKAVNAFNGKSNPGPILRNALRKCQDMICHQWLMAELTARTPSAEMIRHVHREHNEMANGLASHARISQSGRLNKIQDCHEEPQMIQAFFDGSWKDDETWIGGIGVVIYTAEKMSFGNEPDWHQYLSYAQATTSALSAHQMEMVAMIQAAIFVLQIANPRLQVRGFPNCFVTL